MNAEKWGWDDWFKDQADPNQLNHHSVARVISVHKESYMIRHGQSEVFAELAGSLLYSTDSAADLPTTGDWVYADCYDDDTHAIIHGVLPRKTLIKRKAAGKRVDWQLIAANIDVAFIIQSVNENFNLSRLERYLVMVNDSGLTPVILLSKCDLIDENDLAELLQRVEVTAPGVTVVSFSSVTGTNLEHIKGLLTSGKTYCLLGSSGVGKTTLLNSILGSDNFETQTVSKKESKGRHTTTSRELVRLDNGAMIIDTPGMRELGNLSVDVGLDETFADILVLSQQCKFGDCSHTNETGCAILAAMQSGDLSEERYSNYQKIKREAAFNDMSYYQKRQKDKDFGKMVKSVLKDRSKR